MSRKRTLVVTIAAFVVTATIAVPGAVATADGAHENAGAYRLAGTWIVTAETAGERATCIPPSGAPATAETVRLGDIENAGTVLRIPVARMRESSGSFVLVAGRAAEPGEPTVDPRSPEAVQRLVDPLLPPPPANLPSC